MEVYFCLPGLQIEQNELLSLPNDFWCFHTLNKIRRFGVHNNKVLTHKQLLSQYILCDDFKSLVLKDLNLSTDINCFFASPLYQQMDLHSMQIISANRMLEIKVAEAQTLVLAINELLEEDGLVVYAYRPDLWLITSVDNRRWEAPSIWDIPTQIGSEHLVLGENARDILKLQTEIQMLMFNHPLNLARKKNNQLEINGIWLWQNIIGECQLNAADTFWCGDLDCLPFKISNEQVAQKSWSELYDLVKDKKSIKQIVIYKEDLLLATKYADIYSQKEVLQEIENNYLKQIWTDLSAKKISRFHLVSFGNDGGEYVLHPNSHRYFWKRNNLYQGNW